MKITPRPQSSAKATSGELSVESLLHWRDPFAPAEGHTRRPRHARQSHQSTLAVLTSWMSQLLPICHMLFG